MKSGQVGQPYQPGQDQLEEKLIYRLDNDGHGLVIVKTGISTQEIENIQKGAVELGIYIDGPIIFFLFKFGIASWNDAPFSWHTVPRGIRVYPEEAEDSTTLRVTLVEAVNGIVLAERQVALTPEFADKLNAAIKVQANSSFNGLSYGKHLNVVYNQYTAEDMVDIADARMT